MVPEVTGLVLEVELVGVELELELELELEMEEDGELVIESEEVVEFEPDSDDLLGDADATELTIDDMPDNMLIAVALELDTVELYDLVKVAIPAPSSLEVLFELVGSSTAR